MKKKEPKLQLVAVKLDTPTLKKVDRLAKRLDLDRSKFVRVAIDDALKRYLDETHQGELMVMDAATVASMEERHFNLLKRHSETLEAEILQLIGGDKA